MPNYSWITLQQAVNALQGRLQSSTFWTYAECVLYLTESLRCWNALTEQWNAEYVYTPQGSQWTNFGTQAGSPRLRTVTDTFLYTQMQYMLLEPPTGGTWTGTNQFDIASFQFALQKRRDEVIQATGCNLAQLAPLNSTPGTRRTILPDNVLEPVRNRFLAVFSTVNGTVSGDLFTLVVDSAQGITVGMVAANPSIPLGSYVTAINGNSLTLSLAAIGSFIGQVQFFDPLTLTREDTQAFQYFEPDYLQTYQNPASWSVPSEPPLSFDVDTATNTPGLYDVIAIVSGPVFNPPNDSLLGVPDDWSWLPMYGALADILGSESERTDRERAAYCLKRFTDGIKIMRQSNWLVQGNINGIPVDTPSLFEQDTYSVEWQNDPDVWPALVQAGMDFLNACPVPQQAVGITLVGNAPIPQAPTDFVQVSRDVFDVILSYAQRLASFKQGGQEFAVTAELEEDFYRSAAETNKRLLRLGIFTDVLHSEGQRQNVEVRR